MKTKLLAIATVAAMTSGFASAATFGVGDTLPSASVADGGLAIVKGDAVEYSEWSSKNVKSEGTVVIVAKAGRAGVAEMVTEEFGIKLDAQADVLNIVNKDDSAFGTGMFVEGAIEEGMLKNPEAKVVLDRDGDLFSEWELEEESAAVIIVKDGKVTYFHEGALSADDESQILELAK